MNTNIEGKEALNIGPLPKKKRDSGLELLRIITMLLIIARHYVEDSGLILADGPIYTGDPLSGRSIFLLIFGAWGRTGINCFVLITGYFMCKSNITLKKFLKLLFTIEFYKITFYLIFLITRYQEFSLEGLIKAILPVYSIETEFTNCYMVFFLFIPFLNILIKNMNKKQHQLLILLCSFVYILFGTLPNFSVTMNYVSWFMVLYIIASYVRMYPIELFDKHRIWGLFTVCGMCVSTASVILCAWIGTKTGQNMAYYFVTDSNTFLAVITAFSAFMFFKNIHFYNRYINLVASASFGVLLIHANSDTMRRWLWGDLLNNVGQFYSDLLIFHAIGSVLCIYAIGTAIDLMRIYFIEKPLFKMLGKRFAGKYLKFK